MAKIISPGSWEMESMKTLFAILSLSLGAWAVNETVELMNTASAIVEQATN